MFRHLLKLIWNRKRKNALLIIEIFLSFFVFFAVLSFAIYNLNNYRKPLGYNYEGVSMLSINWGQMEKEDAWEKSRQMQEQLALFSQIESITLTERSLPFTFSNNNTTIKRNDTKINSDYFDTDAEYAKVLGIEMLEGRWYEHSDTISSKIPSIVINKIMRDALFETGEIATGQKLTFWDREFMITGVIDKFRRRNEFAEPKYGMFVQINHENFAPSRILIKSNENADVAFEEKMMRSLAQISPDVSFELEYLDDKRVVANRIISIPLIAMSVICGFLLINVALGLFGVLWYNINQRKGEIGLRQAMGSTANGVANQFISETWILASFGVLIGVFFAVQFPILNVFDVSSSIYLLAILASILLVFLLTTICAFFPSKQAAHIQPAIALHEE